MADLVLSGLRKSFGAFEAIKGVDLTVDDGEFVVFVGPSGCGKSTTLRLIAGLEDVTSGTIRLGGQDVTRTHPSKRGAAMVFQSYALFPHMTVAENIGFGLRLQKVRRAEIDARVGKVAETLKLTDQLRRTPRELSGGQRQRVAIGRSIIRDPKIFLFDEPLSNLDAALRVQMRLEIAHLHQRLGATMVYVTHDQVEAMTLADRIIVFNDGQIEQIGTPMDLYANPANRFVAGFIGAPAMNFLAVRQGDGGPEVAGFGRVDAPSASAGVVEIGFRPEHFVIDEADGALPLAQVELVEHLGADTFAYVRLAGEQTLLTLRLPGNTAVRAGAQIRVRPDWAQVHWFDARGRAVR